MTKKPAQPEPKPHALADHLNGEAVTHEHGGAFDHDHDDFEAWALACCGATALSAGAAST